MLAIIGMCEHTYLERKIKNGMISGQYQNVWNEKIY
jgi:hypothetical protein